MTRELTYAPLARSDFEAARRWLTQPGAGPAARRKLVAILDAIEDWRALHRRRGEPASPSQAL